MDDDPRGLGRGRGSYRGPPTTPSKQALIQQIEDLEHNLAIVTKTKEEYKTKYNTYKNKFEYLKTNFKESLSKELAPYVREATQEKDRYIEELKEQLEEFRRFQADYKSLIHEEQARSKFQRQKLDEYDQRITELTQVVADRDLQIAELIAVDNVADPAPQGQGAPADPGVVDEDQEDEFQDADDMGERTTTARAPPFSGSSSDTYSPSLWLNNLDNLGECSKWSDDQRLKGALLSLQGAAGIWRETESQLSPVSFATWAAFKTAFLERFQPSTTAVEAVKLVSNLRQKADESVRDFFDRVNHMVIMSCQDALKKEKEAWGAAHQEERSKGFESAQQHFISANFVNGLRPAIRSLVEAKFSSITDRTDLLKAAVEAEVASNSTSTETRRIMALETEIAALRLSTGSGGQNRGNQQRANQN